MNAKIRILMAGTMLVGLLAGCAPSSSATTQTGPSKLNDPFTLTEHWAPCEGEEFYKVENPTDETLKITYTDVPGEYDGGWNYVARAWSYDKILMDRFPAFKKLFFTGKLETTSGSDIVMVKIEGETNIEARFEFTSEERTYELPLTSITDWSKETMLLFFVNRYHRGSGSGVMTFSAIGLTKAEMDPNNIDVTKNGPAEPQRVNYYDGGDELKVMTDWGYNEDENITTAKEGDVYHFTYGEGSKQNDYAFVKAIVQDGTAKLKEGGFKRIHFELSGTAKNVLVKFQKADNTKAHEHGGIDLTDAVTGYDVDITDVLDAGEDGTIYWAMIFPEAGQHGNDLAGEVVLHDCYIDQTDAAGTEADYYNHRVGDEILIEHIFNDQPVYTLLSEGAKHTIDFHFNVPGQHWNVMKIYTVGNNLEELTHITGKVIANVYVQILIKPYDNVDFLLDLEANVAKDIDITFDSAHVTPGNTTGLFLATSTSSPASGKVIIENMKFVKPA